MPESNSFESRILSSLGRLEDKLEQVDNKVVEFRDELKAEMGQTGTRLSLLENFQKSYEDTNRRFLDQVLPTQERILSNLDNRVRLLEKEQIQAAKIAELETALMAVKEEAAKTAWQIKAWGGIAGLLVTGAIELVSRIGFPH